MRLPLFLAFGLLTGCTSFPELDSAVGAQAGHGNAPRIVPIEPLLAQGRQDHTPPALVPEMEARVARLKARARALSRPILRPQERNRLRRAVTRHRS